MLENQSYRSMLELARSVLTGLRSDQFIKYHVQEIKTAFQRDKEWRRETLDMLSKLERRIERDVYFQYSAQKPSGVTEMNDTEQVDFISSIKELAKQSAGIDIRIQGKESEPLGAQSDEILLGAEAFRILPKDFEQRRPTRRTVGARLTVTVNKQGFINLAGALAHLFGSSAPVWLEQAKIMGAKVLGTRTDHAVIYLSQASLEHANEIYRKLERLLSKDAFVEHVPMGMHAIGKGVSYAETIRGDSTSHGQSRAKLIASGIAQSLLTARRLEDRVDSRGQIVESGTLGRALQERGYDRRDPALVARALKDAELRAGLTNFDVRQERLGSPQVRIFAADPDEFARHNVISADGMTRLGRLPAQGRAKLVAVEGVSNVYELEYTAQEGEESVPAYFLGFNGADQRKVTPAFVDIPKNAPAGSFLFTGSLSGCSVIVTELNDTTYRVYHDGRVNSSALYDHVVMATDFRHYQIPGADTGYAATYLQFRDGQWQLVTQLQDTRAANGGTVPMLRQSDVILRIQRPDLGFGDRNQLELNAYRQHVQQRLLNVANQFEVSTQGVSDGVYERGEFAYDHPAIASWNRLRDEIRARIEADTAPLRERRTELRRTKRHNAGDSTLIDEQIRQINLTLDHYRCQYDPLLSESASADRGWLWQQIKARNGMTAVVRTDDVAIQAGAPSKIDNLAARYERLESVRRSRRHPSYSEGLRNFRNVTIPGWQASMTSREMKELYVGGELTIEQLGALAAHIDVVSQAEHITKVLGQTSVIAEDFRHTGITFERLIPQDFFLTLVGEKYAGRCLPLVRAMAVAIGQGGQASANSLIEKLFVAAANPDNQSSTLLKMSLGELHSNVDAVRASRELGTFKLKGIAQRLSDAPVTTMFSMETPAHSMMAGVTIEGEVRRYYFYDPNFGVFAFADGERWQKAMQQHFIQRDLASYYGVFGSKTSPEFELVEINTAGMADVPVGNSLTVHDLTSPIELGSSVEQNRMIERTVSGGLRVERDLQLRTALAGLDATRWAERFETSSVNLMREADVATHWAPVIANTEDLGDGNYRVQFINLDRPEEERWVETRDETFTDFRDFLDEHFSTLGDRFTFEEAQFRPKVGVDDAEPVDGLNAGFAVQMMVQWLTEKHRGDAAQGKASPDLATALKVHGYVALTQVIHGSVQDAAKVTQLVRAALRGEALAADTSLTGFSSAFGHAFNEGGGLLLSAVSVGLDAYELAHAENETQKAVFGTQLAFDSASLVTQVAGIGAGVLGASAASAVLGGVGVILGGLAIGFGALAKAFGAITESAQAVGRYFFDVDAAYRQGGYRYDADKRVLIPLSGAVIDVIDLARGQVDFGSQYIYRTHHGRTGSGRGNYFFWAGDFPTMVRDRAQAIEVRSGIGSASQCPLEQSDSETMILPATPKSYISYSYQRLPGTTSRHDRGFDIIRKLEQDYRFDYDFYIFPSEYTINRIWHEFVDTAIKVILDKRTRQLIMPVLPKELHGYLRYDLAGAGSGEDYVVVLNEGASVRIETESGTEASRWVIDAGQLSRTEINVERNRLTIGGVRIDLDPIQTAHVLVIDKKRDVLKVDFMAGKTEVVRVDAKQWPVPGPDIDQHLRDLAKLHRLAGQFVAIDNYRHEGRDVGRAYYEVAHDRVLFTDFPDVVTKTAELGAVLGEFAYFFDRDTATVWRVQIATGKVDAQFRSLFDHTRGRISRMWEDGELVHFARRYTLDDGSEGEICYAIEGDRFEIVGAVGSDGLLRRLAELSNVERSEPVLSGYDSRHNPRDNAVRFADVRTLEPIKGSMMTIFGEDWNAVAHRYWIREDGVVIKPNLAPTRDSTLRPEGLGQVQSAWPIPSDLILAGCMPLGDGKEVFYFYSHEYQLLFRQEGAGQKVLDAAKPTAFRVETQELINVVNVGGSLLIVTKGGLIERIDEAGQLYVEAVNEHWLNARGQWWTDLAAITGHRSPTVAVLGVKGPDRTTTVPVWYHNGKVFMVSPALGGKALQFLGTEPGNMAARIFDPASGMLYRQSAMNDESLNLAFGNRSTASSGNWVLVPDAPISATSEIRPGLRIRSADRTQSGLRLTTRSGEVLTLTEDGALTLIAVDATGLNKPLESLSEMARKWKVTGVVSLLNWEAPVWLDSRTALRFIGNGLDPRSPLSFIGTVPEKQAAYVYNADKEALVLIKNDRATEVAKLASVKRIGSVLMIQGRPTASVRGIGTSKVTLPLVDGIDAVVLAGTSDSDTYRVSDQAWAHYQTVVIDNRDPGGMLDRVILHPLDATKFLASRRRDDLVLSLAGEERMLILRNVYDSRNPKYYRHLQLDLAGSPPVIKLDKLATRVDESGGRRGGALLDLAWAGRNEKLN